MKVAILGGGVGGITTALELTDPSQGGKYDVTLYQLGWRIGGKGASGRNPDVSQRIEEHGLHVWAGLYDNAFRLMRGAYEELGRAPDAPLATWRDAFKPVGTVALMEEFDGHWHPWVMNPPTNDQLPGEPDAHLMLPFWSYIGEAFSFVLAQVEASHRARHQKRTSGAGFFTGLLLDLLYWFLLTLTEVAALAVAVAYRVLYFLSSTIGRLLPGIVRRALYALFHQGQRLLAWLLQLGVRMHWRSARRHIDHPGVRRAWIFVNFGTGFLRGLIEDDLYRNGFDSIEHLDFREWLRPYIVDDRHAGAGGESLTMNSPLARFLYDADFAYVDGDLDRLQFSAGAAVYTILRLGLTWKGAVIWRMQAGMGDTVFTPAYEVLRRRGVKFRFFHKVKGLHLSEDGASIGAITIAKQAELSGDRQEYEPLVEVNGLDCWPSEPHWDQLEDGARYRDEGVDFEAWCGPELEPPMRLERGRDFDRVVLGISLGGLPYICGELIEARASWQDMVHRVRTIATQAGQLWTHPTAYQLGWTQRGQPLLATYDASNFDTWADMSELLVRESWPGLGRGCPLNIGYFCGPMREAPLPETPHGPMQDCRALDQKAADRRVRDRFVEFLDTLVGRLWPNAAGPDGFDWDVLCDNRPTPGVGVERIDSQYYRANVQPTERYVMSLPDTSRFRLQPGASGFDNLVLAGDWTWNAFNGGCVEAGTISGMLAANAISGQPRIETIVGLTFGYGSYAERLDRARDRPR